MPNAVKHVASASRGSLRRVLPAVDLARCVARDSEPPRPSRAGALLALVG